MASVEGELRVEVVCCPAPGHTAAVQLVMAAGSTLAQALTASGLLGRQSLPLEGLCVGIWGRVQPLNSLLRDRDRVEIYRPLQVDPKEARRLRYRDQRAGSKR